MSVSHPFTVSEARKPDEFADEEFARPPPKKPKWIFWIVGIVGIVGVAYALSSSALKPGCFAADGSVPNLVTFVKGHLRDPNSFEHSQTYVTKSDPLFSRVSMEYRARNAFGGMNVANIEASIAHEGCVVTVLDYGALLGL